MSRRTRYPATVRVPISDAMWIALHRAAERWGMSTQALTREAIRLLIVDPAGPLHVPPEPGEAADK